MAGNERRVGVAQLAPALGDLAANLELHQAWVQRAVDQQVDLLCFPELSLTGYILRDLVPHVAIRTDVDDPAWLRLLEFSQRIPLVVGFVEEDHRHLFFSSQAYLQGGRALHVHRKVYLPTYGLFEEGRYFAAGQDFRAFDCPLGRVGLLICEDAWHPSSPLLLSADGADILIISSSSPGYGIGTTQGGPTENGEATRLFTRMYAQFFTSFVIHSHRVGNEEGISFYGGSQVLAPTGQVVAEAPLFEETLLIADIDLGELRRVRRALPLVRDEKLLLVRRELERIIAEGRQL